MVVFYIVLRANVKISYRFLFVHVQKQLIDCKCATKQTLNASDFMEKQKREQSIHTL